MLLKWFLTPYLTQDCRIALHTVWHKVKLKSIRWPLSINGKFHNKTSIMSLERNQTGTRHEGRRERGKRGKERWGKGERGKWIKKRKFTVTQTVSHWCCLYMSWVTKCTWGCQVNKNFTSLSQQRAPQHVLYYANYTTITLCKYEMQLFVFLILFWRERGNRLQMLLQSLWGQKEWELGWDKKKKEASSTTELEKQDLKPVITTVPPLKRCHTWNLLCSSKIDHCTGKTFVILLFDGKIHLC